MRTSVELAHREVIGHLHDAVDLGGFAVRAADARLVDEHHLVGADEVVAATGGDVVLQLAQLGQALGGEAGGRPWPSRPRA